MNMKVMLRLLPLALLLYSCSNELNEQTLDKGVKKVSFTSNIEVKKQSRAIDSSWETGDRIGLYMLSNSSKELMKSNICYVTKDGSGNYEAAGTPIYYPEDGAYVDFIAYYPYDNSISTTYKVNVSKQQEPKEIDLMYSKNLTERNSKSVKGNLQFYHQLSRLNIQLNATDNTDINSVSVVVKGVNTEADFDILTGKLTANKESKGNVSMYRSGAMAQAILIPTEDVKDITIALTSDGKTKEVALPADITKLEPGTNYSFTISVKNGLQIEVPDDSKSSVWRETPVIPEDMLAKKHIRYINHFMPNDPSVRNYSLLYDESLKIAHWVAYPYCKYYNGTAKRTDAWDFDPKIDQQYQLDYSLGGFGYGSIYDRGHQIPSADRLKDAATNKTTFYASNITPQIGKKLNQSIWGDLENKVRSWSLATDTIFIVTGASVKESTTDTQINYTEFIRDGKKVAVPKFYYKALARKVKGQFRTIAFKLNQQEYSDRDFMKCAISVAELEKLTGFTFFPSLDAAIKKDFDLSYWK